MNYFGRWTKGDEPHAKSTPELRGWLNFYRFIRACRPDDNELLDKIHDLKNVLNQQESVSLDNQTKQN